MSKVVLLSCILASLLVGQHASAEELGWQIQASGMRTPEFQVESWDMPRHTSQVTGASLLLRLPLTERLAMRLDAGRVQDLVSGGALRMLLEYRESMWAAGLGIGVISTPRFAPDAYDEVTMPVWLRLGPEVLHVRMRAFDGGPTTDPNDFYGFAIGGEVPLDRDALLFGAVGLCATAYGTGSEYTLGWQLPPLRMSVTWRKTNSFQSDDVTQIGVVLGAVFGSAQSATREVPPPARAVALDQTVSSAWPDARAVLTPGSWFSMSFSKSGGRGGSSAPSQAAVGLPIATTVSECTVDEHLQAGRTVWSHVNCLPELPANAPQTWRTGCYVTTAEGIWRMPACPGEDPPVGATPELLMPAMPLAALPWAADLGLRPVPSRWLTIGRARVPAVCVTRAADGSSEQCFAGSMGLAWSGQRSPNRMAEQQELAVGLVSVREDGRVDRAAPHLRFSRPDSAQCALAPACLVFGRCQPLADGCVAARDADCRAALMCRSGGQCTAKSGCCAVTNDDDCSRSAQCTHGGLCSFGGGRCLARGIDCAQAAVCRQVGQCVALSGRCRIGGDIDCRKSLLCLQEGRCQLQDGQCQALEDGDCRATEACVLDERCLAIDGRCVKTDPLDRAR